MVYHIAQLEKGLDSMAKKLKYTAMPLREKLERISDWILEKKGKDVLALDLIRNHTFTEGIIIVTANSVRHAQGLADYILQECKTARFEFLRKEGYHTGMWNQLDLNDLVISILQEETRELYRLEDLWKNADVVLDAREQARQSRSD